jgi:hypothetical protein
MVSLVCPGLDEMAAVVCRTVTAVTRHTRRRHCDDAIIISCSYLIRL